VAVSLRLVKQIHRVRILLLSNDLGSLLELECCPSMQSAASCSALPVMYRVVTRKCFAGM
jgi:hypothetical protein